MRSLLPYTSKTEKNKNKNKTYTSFCVIPSIGYQRNRGFCEFVLITDLADEIKTQNSSSLKKLEASFPCT